jgi:hypothetical protein
MYWANIDTGRRMWLFEANPIATAIAPRLVHHSVLAAELKDNAIVVNH